ncbi:bacillithiol system redox-active protein YtxJ [Urechidicola sp. KH5]
MSLFKKVFKEQSDNEKSNDFWVELLDIATLKEIEQSELPVLIFKHSTRCGISSMVWRRFKQDYSFSQSEVTFYYLDLLRHRTISNEITARYNVVHESPQLIVLNRGEVIAHASHSAINDLELASLIAK